MVEENKKEREEYVIRIGPLLKRILEKQKIMIKDVTWEVWDVSDWVAGEVLAKKINQKRILE